MRFVLQLCCVFNATPFSLYNAEDPPTGWKPVFCWLAVRLLSERTRVQDVRDCEQALVVQEGFALQRDFTQICASELSAAYLSGIGITKKGNQQRIINLHKELNVLSNPPAPAVPVAASAIPELNLLRTAVCELQDMVNGLQADIRACKRTVDTVESSDLGGAEKKRRT